MLDIWFLFTCGMQFFLRLRKLSNLQFSFVQSTGNLLFVQLIVDVQLSDFCCMQSHLNVGVN